MGKSIDTTTQNDTECAAAPAERSSILELEVVQSPDFSVQGCRIGLDSTRDLVIGRLVNRGFSITDQRISRSHLRIVWDPRAQVFRCADLTSANGSFLNGRRVESGLLGPNDVLRMGDSLFVVTSRQRTAATEEREARAARSTLPILIVGATGTGKEILARKLHAQSGRNGALVTVNCATLSRELAAAELFGHTRGSFSGATAARAGLFRAAERGTLFLDEIADLPKDVQPTLLRALQEKAVRPVGADQEIPVDVRIICATHLDLGAMLAAGQFREDLYARLAHVLLQVPPLRERRHEILSLARQFAPELDLTASVSETLLLWDWPRNVRELRALMELLAVTESPGGRPTPERVAELLPRAVLPDRAAHTVTPSPVVASTPRALLGQLLAKHRGNIAAVARELGKPRSQIYRWIRAYDLFVERNYR